ncbi:MAG: hypothetical protein ABL984_03610 [Pyrinomonadaceae bacterium]
MCRSIVILIFVFVLNLCVSAQLTNSEFKTLVWNNSHVVSYEIGERNVILRLEAIADYTDDSDPAVNFGKRDFVSIRVDVNNNNQIDERVDLAFGIRSNSSLFCPQFLYDERSSSACCQQRSGGGLKISFDESPFHATQHPIFEFTIPKSELTGHSTTVGLVFRFHSAGAGFAHYPAESRSPLNFEKTLPLTVSVD